MILRGSLPALVLMITAPEVRSPYCAEGIPRITSTLSILSVEMPRKSTPAAGVDPTPTLELFFLAKYAPQNLLMKIPFMEGKLLDLGILSIPAVFFVVIGTVNGTNFTDGLDGLASSVTVMVATFFSVVAIGTNSGIEPVTCAVAGALLGFLLFNVYPASVFMGDTGSLALGGFVAGTAYMLQMPIFIVIVGFIYLAEVLSVMMQVSYFKITKGKRIFKMAPIHHHFELCGWSETRVVAVFSIVTALLCLIALMAM